MTQDDPLLDRAAIEAAFGRLGDRLARRGVVADIYVFGGAAMALAYDARRATRDIDAVFQPHGVVLDEARAVADELGLPHWWLNEHAAAPHIKGVLVTRRWHAVLPYLLRVVLVEGWQRCGERAGRRRHRVDR